MEEFVIKEKARQRWLIALTCAVSLMITFDYSSLNISISAIAQYFGVKVGVAAWLPTVYLLIITSSLLGFGKLGDIIGYKKVYVMGLSVFCLGGFLCAVSPSFNLLLAARSLQSFGQAMYSPICIAMLTTFLPADMKGKALGLYATFQGLGLAIGPAAGGFINSYFSWRGNFLIAVPVSLLIIFGAAKIIPSRQAKAEDKRFDFFGAVLLFIALAALLYAVNSGVKMGWSNPLIISCGVISLASFIIFFLLEKRISYPLLDLKLFQNRDFTFSVSASFLGLLLNMGMIFLFPFYLQMLKGLDITKAGLVMVCPSIMMMLLAPFSGSLSDRIGSRKVCSFGMVLVIVAFGLFSFLTLNSSLLFIVLALLCLGTGMGFFIAPNNKQVMVHAPQGKQGVASGVYKICLNAGSSIGIAVFMLVLAQVVLFDVAKMNLMLSDVRSHSDVIMSGFRGAFIFGLIIAVINLIFCVLSKDKRLE
ncbi:MAG: MFS transporter [Candidatus Omnitrophica bacterium]|nr:MFS transporter [Candidatus Omnitrophota bacterium]MBU1870418.1 MFS transporter [Candidatus Omnitrophota bacterium]